MRIECDQCHEQTIDEEDARDWLYSCDEHDLIFCSEECESEHFEEEHESD